MSKNKAGIFAALGAPVALTLTLGTMPAYAGQADDHRPDSDARGNSAATITLDGCYLSSTKDISYIDYSGEGSAVGKDESVGSQYVDLSTVEGIENITTVEVKSGTTVETFAVDCGGDDSGETGGDETGGDDGSGNDEGTDKDEPGGDDESGGDDGSDSDDESGDDNDSGNDESGNDESGGDESGDDEGTDKGDDSDNGAGDESGDKGENDEKPTDEKPTDEKDDVDVVDDSEDAEVPDADDTDDTGDADGEAAAGGDSRGGDSRGGTAQGGTADAGVNAQGDAVLGVEKQAAPAAPSTSTYAPTAAGQPSDMVLPQTGAEDNKVLALGGLGLVLAGAATILGRRRYGLGR